MGIAEASGSSGDSGEKRPSVERPRYNVFHSSISRKILFGYIGLSVLLIVISFFVLSRLEQLNRINEAIIRNDLPLIDATEKMVDILLAQEAYIRRYAIMGSPEILSLFWEKSRDYDRMNGRIMELPQGIAVPVGQFRVLHEDYNKLLLDGLVRFRTPTSPGSAKYLEDITRKQEELIGGIRRVAQETRVAQNEKMHQTSHIGTSAFRVAALLCISGILLGISASIFITLIRPPTVKRKNGPNQK